MSVWSSWSYGASFPKDTKINPESRDYKLVQDEDDHYEIEYEGDGGYAEHILEDLVELFGMPLDEVKGLVLHAWYRFEDEDFNEVTVDIKDGKVTCEQTVKVWEPCSLSETGISIGHEE